MDGHGEALLTWFREAFRAKTFQPPEKAPVSPESGAASGLTWPASSVKFDRDLSSWKIHPCLFPGASMLSSPTLPRWGTMRNGELWEQTCSVLCIVGSDFGLWQPKLKLPTPCAGTNKWGGTFQEVGGSQNPLRGTWLGRQTINPGFWEEIMGWPTSWTDCELSAMDKFQQWQRSHGNF